MSYDLRGISYRFGVILINLIHRVFSIKLVYLGNGNKTKTCNMFNKLTNYGIMRVHSNSTSLAITNIKTRDY